MLQHERRAAILQRVRAGGATEVGQLARSLGVSASTIRRDLTALDGEGALRRVHGGVRVDDEADALMPFAAVVEVDPVRKDAIGRRAAESVVDGESVLLDIGTTVMSLARHLRGRPVTVLTSSLAVVDVLRDDPTVELIVLGGVVRRAYHSLVGLLTEDALGQVHADRAFLGASGIRPDGRVLDSTRVEVPVKRAMLRAAEHVTLLADAHKFPGTGGLRVCDVGDLDELVTDADADADTVALCRDRGVQVVCS